MEYAKFKKEMKDTYTILAPTMLPIHFSLFAKIFAQFGYNIVILDNDSRDVVDEGLKNVHNDTCYPALLVVGQFIDALKSGKYDVNKVACIMTQTGGGCRASNYIALIRKALYREYPQIPVISLNFSGLEKDCGFEMTLPMIAKMSYGVLYGDMLMTCYNQTRPYEKEVGQAKKILDKVTEDVANMFKTKEYKNRKKVYQYICDSFSDIDNSKRKPKVGIVGEIYVKYSPLANNHLEDFLIQEGCEPVVPGLLDFVMYCIVNNINDHTYYKMNKKTILIWKFVYRFLYRRQKEQIKFLKNTTYDHPHDFEELRRNADAVINQGVKMGEGWLIPAEMISLGRHGVLNVVCAQPFGCLPNHIVGKGMIRPIKELIPEINIAAIDYDPGATRVNQENRIKLMLSNIKDRNNK